jgi:response regulator RpfG family c-di-GMP phosphodiesterase
MKDCLENQPNAYTVLCVDDEVNILSAIKRVLHKQDYTVLTATSGPQALEILKNETVHVIVSDMKMPNMSGAEFLQKSTQLAPTCYRILLTGYSDMSSTIDAVNKGDIDRYLQKPWDNKELLSTVNDGLEKAKLMFENNRLHALVKKQNALLTDLNHNLDEKVKLRSKQILIAMRKLERNTLATQRVLYNFISINPHLDGGFAQSVSHLAGQLADQLSLTEKEHDQVTFASLLCEIGLLGLDTQLYAKPFCELNYNQQHIYMHQSKYAEQILSPAKHLRDELDIITCQFECVDGTGPNQLSVEQIPKGAQILAVARDFWRYKLGRINKTPLANSEAISELKKYRGIRYDPTTLDLLVKKPELISGQFISSAIQVTDLRDGMRLKEDILTKNHILVLPKGHVFSNTSIRQLANYEKQKNVTFSIYVLPEKQDAVASEKVENLT